jgi:hypothetical protein
MAREISSQEFERMQSYLGEQLSSDVPLKKVEAQRAQRLIRILEESNLISKDEAIGYRTCLWLLNPEPLIEN